MHADFQFFELPDWSGGFRQDIPAGDPKFPPGDSPEMANAIVKDGACVKWPGTVKYTTAQLLGGAKLETAAPVRLLVDFRMASGNRHLLASDGRDLFRHDPAPPASWVCITPIQQDAATVFTHDSKTVTCVAATWLADGVAGGMAIKSDTDGVWYEIDTVDDEDELTLVDAYLEAGGSHTATIRRRLTATGEYWLRALTPEDKVIVVNGVDPPLWWDGDEGDPFIPLGGGPEAGRFATTFAIENLLVLANFPTDHRRLMHSDARDYEEWTDGYAEFYDFHKCAGVISGLDGSHENLVLFMQDALWRGWWSHTDVQMMWEQIPSTAGPVYPSSLLRLGGAAKVSVESPLTLWAYFGQKQIYAFDLELVVPIGEEVRSWVFDQFDPEYGDCMVGAPASEWNLAMWSFPTVGSEGVNTQTIAYDYVARRWFVRDKGWSAFGMYDLSKADPQWDQLVGSIDAQDRIFDAVFASPQPIMLCGDEEGWVYYLALKANENGAPIAASRRSRTLTPFPGFAVSIAGAEVYTTARPGSTHSVTLYGGENPHALVALETHAVVVSGSGALEVPFHQTTRYCALEIANGELGQEFGIVTAGLWIKRRAR